MLSKFKTDFLFIGIFLVAYSQLAYIIFGSKGKVFSLVTGFLLITYVTFSLRKFHNNRISLFLTALYIGLLYLIGAHNNHKNLHLDTTLVFGAVSVLLFIYGRIIASNANKITIPKNVTLILIPSLTIIGCTFFLYNQSDLYLYKDVGREFLENDDLNAIGISYVVSILFLLNLTLLTLNINFILKILMLLSLVLTANVILSTLSRGPLLFLTATILFFFIKQYKFKINIFAIIKGVIGITLLYFFLIKTISFFPFIESKLELIIERYTSLSNSFEGSEIDRSSLERVRHYTFFTENINDFILFGMEDYEFYPHNSFLEVIMRWGLLGLPIIFTMLIGIKKTFFKYKPLNNDSLIRKIFILFFVYSFLQSMTSMSLEMNRMLWLSLGFISSKKFN